MASLLNRYKNMIQRYANECDINTNLKNKLQEAHNLIQDLEEQLKSHPASTVSSLNCTNAVLTNVDAVPSLNDDEGPFEFKARAMTMLDNDLARFLAFDFTNISHVHEEALKVAKTCKDPMTQQLLITLVNNSTQPPELSMPILTPYNCDPDYLDLTELHNKAYASNPFNVASSLEDVTCLPPELTDFSTVELIQSINSLAGKLAAAQVECADANIKLEALCREKNVENSPSIIEHLEKETNQMELETLRQQLVKLADRAAYLENENMMLRSAHIPN